MTRGPLRCQICGDVIGAYEPLIVRTAGKLRETSRAAEPSVSATGAEHYHRACFAAQLGEDSIGEPAAR